MPIVYCVTISYYTDKIMVKQQTLKDTTDIIKAMQRFEDIVFTTQMIVRCDGGGAAGEGHPVVYYKLSTHSPATAICEYCRTTFIYQHASKTE